MDKTDFSFVNQSATKPHSGSSKNRKHYSSGILNILLMQIGFVSAVFGTTTISDSLKFVEFRIELEGSTAVEAISVTSSVYTTDGDEKEKMSSMTKEQYSLDENHLKVAQPDFEDARWNLKFNAEGFQPVRITEKIENGRLKGTNKREIYLKRSRRIYLSIHVNEYGERNFDDEQSRLIEDWYDPGSDKIPYLGQDTLLRIQENSRNGNNEFVLRMHRYEPGSGYSIYKGAKNFESLKAIPTGTKFSPGNLVLEEGLVFFYHVAGSGNYLKAKVGEVDDLD